MRIGTGKHESIRTRSINEANWVIENNATVREAAIHFGISKSTVHKDIAERLLHINPNLAARARIVLNIHLDERAMHGGMATKAKYIRLKAQAIN
jgi:putative DeoR family transcriptional regulator (stage III sporulation protein D)